MTVIEAASGKIDTTIALGGVPEFPVSDGKGYVYVNIDDKSEIVQIDSKTLRIQARWPLAPCRSPSGLAFDPQANRLFAACDNGLMAIVDAGTGKLITTLPIGDGPDAAAFDENAIGVFIEWRRTLTVIAKRGDRYAAIQNLRTEDDARTMALDPNNHLIYLSAAKLGPPPAPTPQNPTLPKHPTAVEGTFHVLVASPAP